MTNSNPTLRHCPVPADRISDQKIDGVVIWLHGMGGTPSEKFIRIDYDAGDEATGPFERALLVLCDFAPTLVAAGHTRRIIHDFKHSCIVLRLVPSNAGI